MKDKSLNYTDAYNELIEIVQEIEAGNISVDTLSEKVKRAAILIKLCKEKLTQTEVDIEEILKDLEGDTDA
jgi:exodeoxyribonuclease VII small subunit